MKHVELTSAEVANGLVAHADWFAVYALRKEFPTAPIPEDEDEPGRWMDYFPIDSLEDAITVRFISIDWQKQTAILFYEQNKGWCFEHRAYMSELDEWEVPHYAQHDFDEVTYHHYLYQKGEEPDVLNIRHA